MDLGVCLYARIHYIENAVTLVKLSLEQEKMMREKAIEQKLVTAVKKHGGICPKFVSPGFDGMPDRLVLLPYGRFAFVEVKAPGEKPRPLQLARHRLLERWDLGCMSLTVRSR